MIKEYVKHMRLLQEINNYPPQFTFYNIRVHQNPYISQIRVSEPQQSGNSHAIIKREFSHHNKVRWVYFSPSNFMKFISNLIQINKTLHFPPNIYRLHVSCFILTKLTKNSLKQKEHSKQNFNSRVMQNKISKLDQRI